MKRSAFALVELVACVVIGAVLACLLLVASPGSRHMAWQAGSLANLHEFVATNSSYHNDNTDQFCAFSWRVGVPTGSQYSDLARAPTDQNDAAAAQAVDILRRRGRPDMPVMAAWLPMSFYFHLPLADYLGSSALLRFAVSPGDANRLHWANDLDGFQNGVYLPYQPDPTVTTNWRWPYSSSYRLPLPFGCPDAVTTRSGTVVPSTSTQLFQIITTPAWDLGRRRLSEVRYPSQKVFVFDSAQWQGARQPVFAAYAFARIPMSFVDGSARVRASGDANAGFNPQTPHSPTGVTLQYAALAWDPPVFPGGTELIMRYFWCRGGIQGRDYDGQELDTSQW